MSRKEESGDLSALLEQEYKVLCRLWETMKEPWGEEAALLENLDRRQLLLDEFAALQDRRRKLKKSGESAPESAEAQIRMKTLAARVMARYEEEQQRAAEHVRRSREQLRRAREQKAGLSRYLSGEKDACGSYYDRKG